MTDLAGAYAGLQDRPRRAAHRERSRGGRRAPRDAEGRSEVSVSERTQRRSSSRSGRSGSCGCSTSATSCSAQRRARLDPDYMQGASKTGSTASSRTGTSPASASTACRSRSGSAKTAPSSSSRRAQSSRSTRSRPAAGRCVPEMWRHHVHRRPRRHGHLDDVVAHPADQRRTGPQRSPDARQLRAADEPAGAGVRDHPDLAVLHGREVAFHCDTTSLGPRDDLGLGAQRAGKKISKRDLDAHSAGGFNRYVPDQVIEVRRGRAAPLGARARLGNDLRYNEKDVRPAASSS